MNTCKLFKWIRSDFTLTYSREFRMLGLIGCYRLNSNIEFYKHKDDQSYYIHNWKVSEDHVFKGNRLQAMKYLYQLCQEVKV